MPTDHLQRLREAMLCESCRRYRLAFLALLALIAVTWWLG